MVTISLRHDEEAFHNPLSREIMGHYWIDHPLRQEHEEAETLRDLEAEIERVVLERKRRK